MTDQLEKAVGLLSERGILDKLRAEAQAEREVERAGLMQELAAAEAADEERGAVLSAEILKAAALVAEREKALAEARASLNEMSAQTSPLGAVAGQIRNRLRSLADPAIDEAIIAISLIAERARREFRSAAAYSRPDPLSGKRAVFDESNTENIGDILQACAEARAQMEALKDAPRPADLTAVIERLLDGPRLKLRRLMGV